MVKFFLALILLMSLIGISIITFQKPIKYRYDCYKQLKNYYQSTDFIFRRIRQTEKNICQAKKEELISIYQCFYQADVEVTTLKSEPAITDFAARVLAYSPSSLTDSLEEFTASCSEHRVTISPQELLRATSGLEKKPL